MVNDLRRLIWDTIATAGNSEKMKERENILLFQKYMDAVEVPEGDKVGCRKLTDRCVLEILEHEAIVREMYYDSEGVPTWGVGVTDKSGHRVERYKDNPQSIEQCLKIYIWLLSKKYLREVLKVFDEVALAENELAAALSFHYNTGGIERADWVRSFKQGNRNKAYSEILNWTKPRSIIPRRKAERELFFNGIWTYDGKVLEWPVKKPSYTPDWSRPKLIDVQAIVTDLVKKENANA